MLRESVLATSFLIKLGLMIVAVSGQLHAGTIYVGPAESFGTAVPSGPGSNNERADTISSLTYIFPIESYTVSMPGSIRLTEVNLSNQDTGTITPFLAKYNGGQPQEGSSFNLLVVGDSFTVPAGNSQGVLVNAQFLVGGVNPTISVSTGDVLVAGLYQSDQNVVFEMTGATSGAYIRRGNVIPAALGDNFNGGADFYVSTQFYRYNIGFESLSVPEPSSLALCVTGFAALIGYLKIYRAKRNSA